MSANAVPDRLKYSEVRPPGLPAKIKQVRYNPSNANVRNDPGSYIRFLVNSSAFMDPYKTWINMDVSFGDGPGKDDGVVYQVDNSAYGFFRQSEIWSRGVSLERIADYDVLGAMLVDMDYPVHKRHTHTLEGVGYGNWNNNTWGTIQGGLAAMGLQTTLGTNLQYSTAGGVTPTGPETIPPDSNYQTSIGGTAQRLNVNPGQYNFDGYGSFRGSIGQFTTIWTDSRYDFNPNYGYGYDAVLNNNGGDAPNFTDWRIYWASRSILSSTGQVNSDANLNPYQVYPMLMENADETTWSPVPPTNLTETNPAGFLRYITSIAGLDTGMGPGVNVAQAFFNQNGINGIDVITDADISSGATTKQLFNYALSNGSLEPMFTNGTLRWQRGILPNIETTWALPGTTPSAGGGAPWVLAPDQMQFTRPCIQGGQFKRTSMNSGSFSVPILSGLFGVLMPTAHYKLIPMNLFPELTMEFQVNPWAVFTSGYTLLNTNSENNQPKRAFSITRIELVMEVYELESGVNGIVMAGYNAGSTVYFNTTSFIEGPIYQFQNNLIPGNVQINIGFDSLKSIMWVIIPQDFNRWSWCRRNYRISGNITKMQINVNPDYYPSLPVLANAGNVQPLPNSSILMWKYPNNDYVIQLQKAFGKLNDLNEDQFVNSTNFAVNNRPYAPDNTQANSLPNNPDSLGYAYQECFNQYGWPLIHENRCVGRPIFGISMESMQSDQTVISGISTMDVRPFQIILEFEQDKSSTFPRDAGLYPFLRYDLIIATNKNGIQIIGRA